MSRAELLLGQLIEVVNSSGFANPEKSQQAEALLRKGCFLTPDVQQHTHQLCGVLDGQIVTVRVRWEPDQLPEVL